MKYILTISIGPVQDFIRAARKTRDLWAGSRLLSECAAQAAHSLEASGCTLVFPAKAQSQSAPNKLMVIVPVGVDPDAAQTAARAAAQSHIDAVAQETLDSATKDLGAGPVAINRNAFEAQVGSFLEFYAAWHPLNDEGSYSETRSQVERLLNGRKRLRDFRQPEHATGRPKSSLNAGRETVFEVKSGDNEEFKKRLARIQVRPSENLDGVSLVKRRSQQQFPSTSRLSADPWLSGLPPESLESLKAVVRRVQEVRLENDIVALSEREFPGFKAFPFDTQLIYAADDDDRPEDTGDYAEASKEFRTVISGLKCKSPSPYFAILVADGDRMGRLIDEMETAEEHRDLSSKLEGFTKDAERIVRDVHGALIYSGGDDVLAFLPVDKAIGCADALQTAFQKVSAGCTLSVGIAIVHYQEHLERALEWGRAAERAAKKERASLAVSLHTRSSGHHAVTVAETWASGAAAKWSTAVELMQAGELPQRAPYKLKRLADEYSEVGAEAESMQMLQPEVRQVLSHSRTSDHGEISDRHIEQFCEGFSSVGELAREVNRLLIARRIADAAKQRAGKSAGRAGTLIDSESTGGDIT